MHHLEMAMLRHLARYDKPRSGGGDIPEDLYAGEPEKFDRSAVACEQNPEPAAAAAFDTLPFDSADNRANLVEVICNRCNRHNNRAVDVSPGKPVEQVADRLDATLLQRINSQRTESPDNRDWRKKIEIRINDDISCY
jgi:hypothetical protein